MEFRIKELRERVNLTQTELSERSGVSRSIISGLESGRIKWTSTKTILKIAEALNVQAEDIFFNEDV